MSHELNIAQELAVAFQLPGSPTSVGLLKGGHINQTLLASHNHGGAFVHQKLNPFVFPDLPALSDNVARICDCLSEKMGAARALQVRRTPAGLPYHIDAHGDWWRCTNFIDGARVPNPNKLDEVFLSAQAFGEFVRALVGLEPAPKDTIARFHDLPRRLAALEESIHQNVVGRAASVQSEIAQADDLANDVLALLKEVGHDALPRRIVHNDAKLPNVLLTSAGPVVVDLDTTMLGPLLNDVGEFLRTAAHTSEEDDPDASSVRVEPERFAAIVDGFVLGAGDVVTSAERNSFKAAGPYMALENGVRFLSDHLNGDTYFSISRPNHNLDRARVQFAVAGQLLKLA